MTIDPHILSETGGAWVEGIDIASRSSPSSSSQLPPAAKVDKGKKVENGGRVGTDGEVMLEGDVDGEKERGLWPTGYQKLVCATMK
jgi:hypothetical protein